MWLNEKRITPLQLIIVVCGIFYFINYETKIFKGLPDMIKVGIYAGILVMSVSAGISLLNVKELGVRLKGIILDRNKSAEQKINEIMTAIIPILSEVGDLWEEMTQEQFNKAKIVIGSKTAKVAE